ncbi:hypothetical protein Tco_0333460 [Tanacetum coccineum]
MARIMPPRRFKKKSVKRIVEKRVAKAIEEYEKTRADSNNTGGSGSTNTGGTVALEVQGCSYKTFMNGKPQHLSSGDDIEDDIEAYNNRFHELVLMCPELVSTENKKIENTIFADFLEEIKGNVTTSSKACEFGMMQSTWPGELMNKGTSSESQVRVLLGVVNDTNELWSPRKGIVELGFL